MTTIRDIEAACEDATGQYEAISMFVDRLAQNGYVIVHPDDVPVSPYLNNHPERADGWNACRSYIFGA